MKALAILSILALSAGAVAADPSPSPPLTIRTGQPRPHAGRGLDIARVDGQIGPQALPEKKLSARPSRQSGQPNLQPKWFIDHSQSVKKQTPAKKQTGKSKQKIRAKASPTPTARPAARQPGSR